MKCLNHQELKSKLDSGEKVRLVAVLSPWLFRSKHIPGSINFSSLEKILEAVRPDEELVLYCKGQPNLNSSWAYRLLEEHGYTKLWLYEGGLAEWEAAGLMLETK